MPFTAYEGVRTGNFVDLYKYLDDAGDSEAILVKAVLESTVESMSGSNDYDAIETFDFETFMQDIYENFDEEWVLPGVNTEYEHNLAIPHAENVAIATEPIRLAFEKHVPDFFNKDVQWRWY